MRIFKKYQLALFTLSFRLGMIVLLCFGTTAAQTTYTVTDLGTLGGTFSTNAPGGINNRGLADGSSTLPGDTALHAFLWQKGVMTDLGTLGGPNSGFNFLSLNGLGPSESGQVVGQAETSTPDPNGEDFCGFGTHLICLPFLWQKGVMTPLPTLGGNNGIASGINNRGQVVGTAENTTTDTTCPSPALQAEPVLWENLQIQQQFPTISGDPDGVAGAINDEGQAVGTTGTCPTLAPASLLHATLWENGTVTDLGNLGGTFLNVACNINNQGQVVGWSNLPGDTTFHGFLWQNGVMTDLGTLPGDDISQACGVNEKGQVTGLSAKLNQEARAFLWQNGVMTDLNTLIPAGSDFFLLIAGGINSQGEIVGLAMRISTGEVHAFLATPVQGSESTALPARGATSQSTKVVLPDNVRKLLRQRLGRPFRISLP